MIDASSRTILLPNGIKSYEIVELPDHNNTKKDSKSKYLVTENEVYEMKSVKSDPKSIILESTTGNSGDNNSGQIIQNSELIVTSKFDIVFLLISTLYNHKNKSFITIEDMIDTFEWMGLLPQGLVISRLHDICDTLSESDDEFYKLNTSKVESLLKKRVTKLSEVLSTTKLVTQIKLNLYVDSEGEIPPGMLEQELLYIANDMVMSYVSTPFNLFDFTDLIKYKKDISSKLVLRDLANQPQVNNTSKSIKVVKKKVVVKNTKVAKGKGALDMFFKKK